MIARKTTGTLISGTLSRDPELKETRNGNSFLSLSVKAHSIKDESGKWNSIFVECCLWRDLDKWDGLLQKGDFVEVFGRELKTHESNGKTYYNLDADGIIVDGLVTARWVQMAIDMMQQPISEPSTDRSTDDSGQMPAENELQPSTNDFQNEAVNLPSYPERPFTEDECRIIESDENDVPF